MVSSFVRKGKTIFQTASSVRILCCTRKRVSEKKKKKKKNKKKKKKDKGKKGKEKKGKGKEKKKNKQGTLLTVPQLH